MNNKLLGIRRIDLPPSWKKDVHNNFINFMIFQNELEEKDIIEILKYAKQEGITNPRPITRKIFEFASILHPRLYFSAKKEANNPSTNSELEQFLASIKKGTLSKRYKYLEQFDLTQEYYNSLLFLAGCTLSAAIIQNRYAEGTIDSKLNRLWQYLHYREKEFGLTNDIEDFKNQIISIGNDPNDSHLNKLKLIKKLFANIFQSISQNPLSFNPKEIKASNLSSTEKEKFGFIADFKSSLRENLVAVFVYGSSVTSKVFNDYDVIIVVKDEDQAFNLLQGTNPTYQGFDINLSVYSQENFQVYQIYSGDNLDNNVICIYGEVEIPVKSKEVLVLRNFSFAIIRLRQLLGMASFLSQEGKHFGLSGNENIYHYFIKIPMHITKGVRSAYGDPIDKEIINEWTKQQFHYSIDQQMQLCTENRTWEAISNAYIATLKVMDALNEEYHFIKF
ncbi:hypothetical protein ACFRAE_10455 [Sphingobacterium sp. HJSM2_6]|uniref:hypothetical protein n=1 Tax=Sphingobacterium sp. HJSM2_6 TaxID=3366264 RepID=UPI003BD502B2